VPGRLLALALALLALALAAGSAGAAAENQASASALAVIVRVPGQADVVSGAVSGPPPAAADVAGFAYPDGGGVLSLQRATAEAAGSPDEGVRAAARLEGVSLFGGEVTIASLVAEAEASAGEDGATGGFAGTSLAGVAVLGQAVAPGANVRVALGDFGYVVFLEQAVVHEDEEGPGYRGFVTGAHIFLTQEHGGLPAGSELLLGYAEAAARAPAPPAAPPPSDGGSNAGGGEDGGPPKGAPSEGGPSPGAAPELPHEPERQPPGATPEPPQIVRNPPPGVRPDITGEGYVFPVYGPAFFSDDFGAPRATTGWHHGNDIFAPLGAPVLAVADGAVFSAGWNEIGGWRLWLRDGQGNEYYYAHLSAYSPLAQNGARVEAGDVLGFVGDTGDAQGTPYHLHFEVHPAALLGLGYDGAINPYPYLVAWQARQDATFDFSALAAGPAPEAGAVLLEAEDISTVSGLVPGGLERALGLTEDLSSLLAPVRPGLVAALPGFASLD
jgi:murein DD-endopeptidase MepM/ murein hydrolase activator NlpD